MSIIAAAIKSLNAKQVARNICDVCIIVMFTFAVLPIS